MARMDLGPSRALPSCFLRLPRVWLWRKTATKAKLTVMLKSKPDGSALSYMCVRGSVASARFCPTMYIGIVMSASAATGSQNR